MKDGKERILELDNDFDVIRDGKKIVDSGKVKENNSVQDKE